MAVLATSVIRSEKRHKRGNVCSLSHGVVCSEQDTGRRSLETEPEVPTESLSPCVKRYGSLKREEQLSLYSIISLMIKR
jgi:hypothetical protein